jgi:hypothetical protein
MTIAAGPLYSPRRYRRARIVVFILALLGLMTFAAVRVLRAMPNPRRLFVDQRRELSLDKRQVR